MERGFLQIGPPDGEKKGTGAMGEGDSAGGRDACIWRSRR